MGCFSEKEEEEKANLLHPSENVEENILKTELEDEDDEGLFPFRQCKWVDIPMIPSKILFFLNDSIEVIFISYIVVFLTSVKLNVEEAGLISGSSLITAFIAAPIWGYIADCTGSKKIVFTILCLGSALTLCPMPYIAQFIDEGNLKDKTKGTMFWAMISLNLIAAIFLNPIRGFTVAMVMSIVKQRPKTEYGMQSLYGGVGVVVCSFLTGMASGQLSSRSLSQYTPVFYFFLPLCLLLIPTGILVNSQSDKYTCQEDNEKENKMTFTSRLKLLWGLCNWRNIIFLISVAISGACNNAMGSYLFQLMTDEMKASHFSLGLARTMAGLGEIFMFPVAKYAIKIFGGAINSMVISILSFSARFIMLVFIRNEWLVLPTQLLHGFSFALFWVSAADYTFHTAPRDVYNTVFSFFASVYFNLGGLIGTTVPGVIYHTWGGRTLFLILGCSSGAWSMIVIAIFLIFG